MSERRLIGTMSDAEYVMVKHYRMPVSKKNGKVFQRGSLRLGQRVMNDLGAPGVSWSELYYCEDEEKCRQMIQAEYDRPAGS